jgi:hypothetical protein
MKGKGSLYPSIFLINNLCSYDVNGNRKNIIENESLGKVVYSITENSFRAYESRSEKNCKYFLDNKFNAIVKRSELEDINNSYFGSTDEQNRIKNNFRDVFSSFNNSFNDLYELGFTNQKGKMNINLEKDDIYLETVEIKTSAKKRVKLVKPNLALLKGNSFTESEYEASFNCRINGNDNFDLITKSLSKDLKTSILYKTTYDFQGKKLRDVSFKLDLENYFFVISNNYGGPSYGSISGGGPTFISLDNLSINNYYEDVVNGDVYVYGIFSDRKSGPKGFYVFKFDKEGNKLWESINNIESKDYFEKIKYNSKMQVSLVEYKKNLLFSVSVDDFNEFSISEFSNSTIVDKATGSISKINFITYNKNGYLGGGDFFIRPIYESKDVFKNKSFTPDCFVALSIDDEYMKYIKGLTVKGNHLYFDTIFSDQGIWLVETDNKEYYKVTLFKG